MGFFIYRVLESLKSALSRPACLDKKGRLSVSASSTYKPKFHIMTAHVCFFFENVRLWAAFGEEGFEHYHQTGNSTLKRHSLNLSSRSQVCSLLQYAWIRFQPEATNLQASADLNRLKTVVVWNRDMIVH